MASDEITYSEKIEGDRRNYRWPVKFDITDGYVGIDQFAGSKIERVLLSPAQVKALIAFVSDNQPVKEKKQSA